ncbi:carboxylate-amine ligase [Motiliproteus coralliicola]|uniref:Putative glutamate--cysteine ligase 2 n=1 Tax=Motiliproteus coralliicola TaxID=2283196 RepID=A0A369WD40_9GAMM|nr:carboxylate-amine ligase [Motiliproteus coralliicola]RDE19948.1 carboxylate-amine ligase [Motiliproteus coralliicola]
MSANSTTQAFTLGIEEEYLLVDRQTRQLASDPPEQLFRACAKVLPKMVTHEFLRAQIEVGTKVCGNIGEAREELIRLRQTVAGIADRYGLAIIAASSHPSAYWTDQQHTRLDRYDLLAEDLGAVVRRLLTCGMHVHVGIPDDDQRIDLMNQTVYFLPHLLALSTSSPFWGGDDTGLKSYRLSVFNELPRTGLPDRFSSWSDYQRHVNVLVEAGLIKDASMLWWDIRPSCRFPTLEMRVTDVCTRLEDALCIAALYLATLKMLNNLRQNNQRWREYAPMLIQENRWRAQRYGIDSGLIDFRLETKVDFAELVEQWIELVGEAADQLGCSDEIRHARQIIQQGTSAHCQTRTYQQARAEGADHPQALEAVIDWLIEETVHFT